MRWILFLLVSASLAGCAEAPNDGCNPPDGSMVDCGDGWEGDNPEGVLRGVVVDESIVPIEGAIISAAGRDVVTDVDGRFVMADVEPGVYVVQTTATFYNTVQTTVEVGAASASARIMLTRIIFDTPYLDTSVFDGFLACSSNTGGLIAEECGEGAGIPCEVPVVGCQRVGGHPNNEPFVTFYAEGPSPQTIQGEIVWTPTLLVGGGVQGGGFTALMATNYVCDPVCTGDHNLDDKRGHSPLTLRTDDGQQDGRYFGGADTSLENASITPELPISIFVWPDDRDYAAVMFEQKFEVYRTVSYVLPLPDDWSFADGDEPPF